MLEEALAAQARDHIILARVHEETNRRSSMNRIRGTMEALENTLQRGLAKNRFGSMTTMRALNKFRGLTNSTLAQKRGTLKRFGRTKPKLGRSKTRWMAALRKVDMAHSLGGGPRGHALTNTMNNSSTSANVRPALEPGSKSSTGVMKEEERRELLRGSLVAQPGSTHMMPLVQLAARRIARRRRSGSRIQLVTRDAAEIAARKANPAVAAFMAGTSAAAKLAKGHPTHEKAVSRNYMRAVEDAFMLNQKLTGLTPLHHTFCCEGSCS